MHLFRGQKLKGQGHEAQKTVQAWICALLWALASSSCLFVEFFVLKRSVRPRVRAFRFVLEPMFIVFDIVRNQSVGCRSERISELGLIWNDSVCWHERMIYNNAVWPAMWGALTRLSAVRLRWRHCVALMPNCQNYAACPVKKWWNAMRGQWKNRQILTE